MQPLSWALDFKMIEIGKKYKITDNQNRLWGFVTITNHLDGAAHGILEESEQYKHVKPLFEKAEEFSSVGSLVSEKEMHDVSKTIANLNVCLTNIETNETNNVGITHVSDKLLFSCQIEI